MTGGPHSRARAAELAALAEVREHSERLVRDARAELAGEIGELRARFDRTSAASEDGPEPVWWGDLTPDQQDQHLADIRQWVDDVLHVYYPQYVKALRPCWSQHAPALVAVHAAWLAWHACWRGDQRRGTDPAAYARDWLPALARELGTAFPDDTYGLGGCAEHPDRRGDPDGQ